MSKNRLTEAQEEFARAFSRLAELQEHRDNILKDLNKKIKNKEEICKKLASFYYGEKFGVKSGDIIKCGNKDFRFVRFKGLGAMPIVNKKTKNGKWSKKETKLDLYDWDTRDTFSLSDLMF